MLLIWFVVACQPMQNDCVSLKPRVIDRVDKQLEKLHYSYKVAALQPTADTVNLSPQKRLELAMELSSMAQMQQRFLDWEQALLADSTICSSTKSTLQKRVQVRAKAYMEKQRKRYHFLHAKYGDLKLQRLYSPLMKNKDFGFDPEQFGRYTWRGELDGETFR